MNLDHVFKKTTKGLYHTGINPSVPDDLLCKCKKCGGIVLIDDVRSGGYICPKCGGYMLCKGNKIVCANAECGYQKTAEN